jgi:hypothetical protein
MGKLDEIILQWHRIGQKDRARWLETIDIRIPNSFKERIKQNDKKVLQELILPTWLEWDILRTWALEGDDSATCNICGSVTEKFTNVKNATVCGDCIREIKNVKLSDMNRM